MTRIILAAFLAVLIVSTAHADDGPKISFTFNLDLVTVSIRGVERDDLHSTETKEMLKRAAQLAHYSMKQLRWQKDFPECLVHGEKKQDARVHPCLEWEE